MVSDDSWVQLERRVAGLLAIGDSVKIVGELDAFLAQDPSSPSASAALSYRVQAKEDIEDCAGAWDDFQRCRGDLSRKYRKHGNVIDCPER